MTLLRFPARAWRRGLAAIAVAGLLVACGGGTSQYEPFVPERVLVFGDENSYLTTESDPGDINGAKAGRKYGTNAVRAATATPPNTLDCIGNGLWVQYVADTFGLVYPQCDPTPDDTTDRKGLILARPGAQVSGTDVVDTIESQIAAADAQNLMTSQTLATVMAGTNDVVALFDTAADPLAQADSLVAESRARGRRLGELVNAIVARGPRVVLSTLPDLSLTPWAAARETALPGSRAVIAAMSRAFNEQLQLTIVLDGRLIGLVQADQLLQSMVRFPGSYGLIDAVNPVCDPAKAALPDCTNGSADAGAVAGWPSTFYDDKSANPLVYLWADPPTSVPWADRAPDQRAAGTRLAFGGHYQIGLRAASRAVNNPF